MYFLSQQEGGRTRPIVSKYSQMIYIDTWSMTFRLDIIPTDAQRAEYEKSQKLAKAAKKGKKDKSKKEDTSSSLASTLMIMPGEQARVKITVPNTMPVVAGQTFTLRENNITVGTGKITKTCDPVYIKDKVKLNLLEISV